MADAVLGALSARLEREGRLGHETAAPVERPPLATLAAS